MCPAETSEDWFAWPREMSDDGEKALPATAAEQVASNVFADSGTAGFWSEGNSRRGSMGALDVLGESVCRVTFVHLDGTGDCDIPGASAIWAA